MVLLLFLSLMLTQIFVKHRYQKLQSELQAAMLQQNHLEHEHQQYLLEREIHLDSDRIKRRARVELGMQTPQRLTVGKLSL